MTNSCTHKLTLEGCYYHEVRNELQSFLGDSLTSSEKSTVRAIIRGSVANAPDVCASLENEQGSLHTDYDKKMEIASNFDSAVAIHLSLPFPPLQSPPRRDLVDLDE